ncbi:MAG: hypothetical protein ABH886_07695 [Candidatus Desantisbacteria bacterium]
MGIAFCGAAAFLLLFHGKFLIEKPQMLDWWKSEPCLVLFWKLGPDVVLFLIGVLSFVCYRFWLCKDYPKYLKMFYFGQFTASRDRARRYIDSDI